MILAAGRGERMRPLTDRTPKALLPVAGKPLICWHVERLAAAGVAELVVNVSHLGRQIEERLGDGGDWGCGIRYSREAAPLETAGGIVQALPLLGESPFLLVNCDIWTDLDFRALLATPMPANSLAHLVLVDNPPQHRGGDFRLGAEGALEFAQGEGQGTLTYAGVGIYRPQLFAGLRAGPRPLRPLLRECCARRRLSGERRAVDWEDVGTPRRLAALEARLAR